MYYLCGIIFLSFFYRQMYIYILAALPSILFQFSIRLWSNAPAFSPLSLLRGGNAVYVISQQSL